MKNSGTARPRESEEGGGGLEEGWAGKPVGMEPMDIGNTTFWLYGCGERGPDCPGALAERVQFAPDAVALS